MLLHTKRGRQNSVRFIYDTNVIGVGICMSKKEHLVRVRTDTALHRAATKEAHRCGMNLSQWVRWIVRKAIPAPLLIEEELKELQRRNTNECSKFKFKDEL